MLQHFFLKEVSRKPNFQSECYAGMTYLFVQKNSQKSAEIQNFFLTYAICHLPTGLLVWGRDENK